MSWFGFGQRSPDDRLPRRAERYQTTGLSCPVGEICDLSASGMQVRSPRRPVPRRGEIRQFSISSGSQRLEVTGRVVWVRRASFRGFRLGVKFLHLKPGVEAALVQLARYGFVGRGAGGKDEPPPPRAAMEVEDLYRILGISPSATPEEVASAYRSLARTVHPDICKDEGAGERFTLVSKAYSVLKDPDRRRKYDQLLASCA